MDRQVHSSGGHVMKKTLFSAVLVTAIAAGFAMAPAFADDMKKDDGMKKDSMSKYTMKKTDGMAKDSMAKDSMKKDDGMAKDKMSNDGMKK
jgi:pentapeptide MXKDX repeat protein